MSPAPGAAAPAPFIVGAGRSGTTLLRLMLDAHPELAIPPETHFIPRLAERFGEGALDAQAFAAALADERRWGDYGLDPAELAARVGALPSPALGDALRCFYRLYAERLGKPRFGDKTPGYVLAMAEVERVLPEARFVHLVRDGRAVALAQSERNGRRPRRNARAWRDRVLAARMQRERLSHYMEVRFEDLVTAPEPALRRICGFAELRFDPAMLDYHRTAEARLSELGGLEGRTVGGEPVTAERRRSWYALTREPPRAEEIGRWHTGLEPAERDAVEEEIGELLGELGYEVAR
jgi:hypothetical protein